jgi:Domain of unknown function (DUF1905)
MMTTVTTPIWRWTSATAPASWFFATIDPHLSAEIRYERLGLSRGFGSVPVKVTIGSTTWRTSLFPSKTHNGYLLPIKAAVRKAEGIKEGDDVEITFEV